MSTEADARIIIDKFLREAGWIMPGEDQAPNVTTKLEMMLVTQIMFYWIPKDSLCVRLKQNALQNLL